MKQIKDLSKVFKKGKKLKISIDAGFGSVDIYYERVYFVTDDKRKVISGPIKSKNICKMSGGVPLLDLSCTDVFVKGKDIILANDFVIFGKIEIL